MGIVGGLRRRDVMLGTLGLAAVMRAGRKR